MGRNIDDYLIFLKKNVSEIKALGKEWGMDEDEIACCVEEVLSRSPNPERSEFSPINIGRKLWRMFLFLCKLSVYAFALLIVAIACLFTLKAYHRPSAEYLNKHIQPYSYPVMRFLRLTALPLHDVANITKFYEADCLVDNPFFIEDNPDCRPCMIFKKIKEADGKTFPPAQFSAYANADKPVLLKKTYDRNVTYGDLRKVYLEHKEVFEEDLSEFDSNDAAVPNLGALFDEDKEGYLNASDTLLIHWKVTSVLTTVALRELFPRPSFMPEKAEIILEKHIFIDSPNTATHKLPDVQSLYQLYTQVLGHRRVLLRPDEFCKDQCKSLLVIMEAGDSLLYNEGLYDLFVSKNGDSLSMAYLTLFAN